MLSLMNLSQDIKSYIISGSVNNAKLNIPGYENLDDINFNFHTQDKITKITNLKFIYEETGFFISKFASETRKSQIHIM